MLVFILLFNKHQNYLTIDLHLKQTFYSSYPAEITLMKLSSSNMKTAHTGYQDLRLPKIKTYNGLILWATQNRTQANILSLEGDDLLGVLYGFSMHSLYVCCMYNAIAGTSNKPDFQYQAPPGNIYVFLELLNIG